MESKKKACLYRIRNREILKRVYTSGMKTERTKEWYRELSKPPWSPPSYLFGPVWSVLYFLIAISFGYTFLFALKGGMPIVLLLPFVLNLIFNIAFTPIQFGLRNNELATLDIYLVLITLVVSMIVVYPYIPLVTYINIPYLLWVSFATVLQTAITLLNKKI